MYWKEISKRTIVEADVKYWINDGPEQTGTVSQMAIIIVLHLE